jgi:hypothetical protein
VSSTIVTYCTDATEGSPMDGGDGMRTLEASRLSPRLHSCPGPCGYVKQPKAFVADADYHVAITAHFPVNRMARLQRNMGKYAGRVYGGVRLERR